MKIHEKLQPDNDMLNVIILNNKNKTREQRKELIFLRLNGLNNVKFTIIKKNSARLRLRIMLGFTKNSNAKNISEDNKTSVMMKLATFRFFLIFSFIALIYLSKIVNPSNIINDKRTKFKVIKKSGLI